MRQRTIERIASSVTPLDMPQEQLPAQLRAWLNEQSRTYNLRWLLAHTDSGVIWGDVRDDGLHLSCEAFKIAGVALDRETLQQGRLFGETGELLLWQGATGWRASLRRDAVEGARTTPYLNEMHLLWGTKKNDEQDGFLLLEEGHQGIIHAPPLATAPARTCRAALQVRHYLSEETDTGMLRITASRLVGLLEPKPYRCPDGPAE